METIKVTINIKDVTGPLFYGWLNQYIESEIEPTLKFIKQSNIEYFVYLSDILHNSRFIPDMLPFLPSFSIFVKTSPIQKLPPLNGSFVRVEAPADIENLIAIQVIERTRDSLYVAVTCKNPIAAALFNDLLDKMKKFYQKNMKIVDKPRDKPEKDQLENKPAPKWDKLSKEDKILRLALAQEAEELKKTGINYIDALELINWPNWKANKKSAEKQLYNARMELRRLKRSDPDQILLKVAEKRKERNEERERKKL